jgi:hypothetical protein
MTDKDEALRLALEKLTAASNYIDTLGGVSKGYRMDIERLKAALEAKYEPAAWMYPDDLKRFETSEAYAEAYSIEMVSPTQGETLPLYTTPPQRKPLTDEEMQRIIHEHTKLNPNQRDDKQLIGYIINATRAIEAAHGIIDPTDLKGKHE